MSKPESFYRVTAGFLEVVASCGQVDSKGRPCHKSAAILHQMVRWQRWVDTQDDRDGWFYKSGEQMADDLMGLCSGRYCNMKLGEMKDAGLLLKKEPGNNDDPTLWRVNIPVLQKKLFALGYALDGYTIDPSELSSDPSSGSQTPELSSDPPDLSSTPMDLRSDPPELSSDPPGSEIRQQRELTKETTKETTDETAEADAGATRDVDDPATAAAASSAVDDETPLERYQRILDKPDPTDFLQSMLEYHFGRLVDSGEWKSLPSPSSIGAIWMRVLGDLNDNTALARDFIREKLAELDGEDYPRRVVVKALQDDARQWLVDQHPEHLHEVEVGRNDHDTAPSADEPSSPDPDAPSAKSLRALFEAGSLPHPWQATLEDLKEKVSSHNFDSWFMGLQWHGAEGSAGHLIAGDEFLKSWIEDNYLDLIEDALELVTDGQLTAVEIHTAAGAPQIAKTPDTTLHAVG